MAYLPLQIVSNNAPYHVTWQGIALEAQTWEMLESQVSSLLIYPCDNPRCVDLACSDQSHTGLWFRQRFIITTYGLTSTMRSDYRYCYHHLERNLSDRIELQ